MNRQPTSARELFWRYAAACIEARFQEHKMTEREYVLAVRTLQRGRVPPWWLLKRWFPRPFAWLERENLTCSFENIARYWRDLHRSPLENTQVATAFLVHTIGTGPLWHAAVYIRKQHADGYTYTEVETRNVVNVHQLVLRSGDRVTVHAGLVAEVLT